MNVSEDRARSAFGNEQDERTYRKALKAKQGFVKRFGDDSNAVYHLKSADVPVIGEALGVRNLVMADGDTALDLAAESVFLRNLHICTCGGRCGGRFGCRFFSCGCCYVVDNLINCGCCYIIKHNYLKAISTTLSEIKRYKIQ